MLPILFDYLSQFYSGFNVFQYLTLRAILGVLTALVLSFVIGPRMIKWLGAYNVGQPVRDDGPPTHLSKAGTPTMGGALILVAVGITTLLWCDLGNRYVWVVFIVTMLFGLIGGIDDYLKLRYGNAKGLSARNKFLWQSLVGLTAAIWLYVAAQSPAETTLIVPVFKNILIPMGLLFIPFAYLVIVGASNAVNLTDGLDGLAIMPAVLVGGALGVFAYVTGHVNFSNYLQIPYIAGVGEITVFCAALVGAGLGFLWFNAYPAQVFMGDVGSLALGAAIGTVAVITKQEIMLVLVGGLFVIEALSVIFQVGFFKLTKGRRIFRMAPLHHHFELKGWPEPKVIVRFWIISVALALVSLSTLKLR